jgi:hypothetical protein
MVGSPLVGTWRLVSFAFRSADGRFSYPFGEDALGYLIYTADGYMAASLMAADRPAFGSADTRGGTTEEKAAAWDTYVSYCGPYTLEDGRVVHHAELSLIPGLSGSDQMRSYALDGDTLTISTPPMLQAGAARTSHLVFRRACPGSDAGRSSARAAGRAPTQRRRGGGRNRVPGGTSHGVH